MIDGEPDSVEAYGKGVYAPWDDGEERVVESVVVECENGDVLRYTDRNRTEETKRKWVFETVEVYEGKANE